MKTIRNLLFTFSILFLSVGCKKESTEEKKILEYSTVTDIDGNVYRTVKIGDNWWMAENLKVSRFNDGSPLTLISIDDPNENWATSTLPSYSVINDSLFGFLYNGLVVQSEKQIAPVGWHIPSDTDWKQLEKELGMSESDINQLGWRGQSEAEQITSLYSAGWPEGIYLFGNNKSGFNALPGGCRIQDGRTNINNNTAFWWTSTADAEELYYRYIDAQESRIFRQHVYANYGMSIRCIKD